MLKGELCRLERDSISRPSNDHKLIFISNCVRLLYKNLACCHSTLDLIKPIHEMMFVCEANSQSHVFSRSLHNTRLMKLTMAVGRFERRFLL